MMFMDFGFYQKGFNFVFYLIIKNSFCFKKLGEDKYNENFVNYITENKYCKVIK